MSQAGAGTIPRASTGALYLAFEAVAVAKAATARAILENEKVRQTANAALSVKEVEAAAAEAILEFAEAIEQVSLAFKKEAAKIARLKLAAARPAEWKQAVANEAAEEAAVVFKEAEAEWKQAVANAPRNKVLKKAWKQAVANAAGEGSEKAAAVSAAEEAVKKLGLIFKVEEVAIAAAVRGAKAVADEIEIRK